MTIVEHRAQFANAPRQQFRHECRKRGMLLANGIEILPVSERASNLTGGVIGSRKLRRHEPELKAQLSLARFRLRLRFIEQRPRQHDAKEGIAEHDVAREGDDACGGEHVGDDGVVREGTPVREPAGDTRIEKGGLEPAANVVLAVEEGDVAPPVTVLGLIAANVGDHPRFFLVV